MHLGYYAMHNAPQHSTVASFHALVKLLPPKDQYVSCFRNSVRSRAWFARVDGCSYQVGAARAAGDARQPAAGGHAAAQRSDQHQQPRLPCLGRGIRHTRGVWCLRRQQQQPPAPGAAAAAGVGRWHAARPALPPRAGRRWRGAG
jgi:hypothetical protein